MGLTAALLAGGSAIASAAVGAGTSMYNSSQTKKSVNSAINRIEGISNNMPQLNLPSLSNYTYNPTSYNVNSMLRRPKAGSELLYGKKQEETPYQSNVSPVQQYQYSPQLQAMLRGEIPMDVINQTNRIAAERTGTTNNPFIPDSNQRSQNYFRRSIGQTSQGIMERGLAGKYQYDVLNSDISKFNNQMQAGIDQNTYGANVANSALRAAPDPRYTGYLNDSINLDNLNNANTLAALQFNYGNALNQSMSAYNADMSNLNAQLGAAQTGLSGKVTNSMIQNSMTPDYGSYINAIGSAIGNVYENKYGGTAAYYGLPGMGGQSAWQTPVRRAYL